MQNVQKNVIRAISWGWDRGKQQTNIRAFMHDACFRHIGMRAPI